MPTLAEVNHAEQLDAEELGLTVGQVRNLKQNFRGFLNNKMPFQILSRWVKGTNDEFVAQARAKYIAGLLETELTR